MSNDVQSRIEAAYDAARMDWSEDGEFDFHRFPIGSIERGAYLEEAHRIAMVEDFGHE